MHKKLRRAIGFFLLFLAIVLFGIWYSIDGVIRSQIASRASAALGVKTTLGDVALNVFGGSLTLRQLAVANPSGYAGTHLLTLQTGQVTVQLRSLLTPTVRINTIRLDGLALSLDQIGLNSNLSTVLEHLKSQQAPLPAAAKPVPAAASGGKTLAINRVLVRHITITLRPALLAGQPTVPLVVHLKQITIDQPTNPSGRPYRLADLMAQILTQVALEAAQNAQLPSSVRQSLQAVGNLSGGAGNFIRRATEPIVPAIHKAVQSLRNIFHAATQPSGAPQ